MTLFFEIILQGILYAFVLNNKRFSDSYICYYYICYYTSRNTWQRSFIYFFVRLLYTARVLGIKLKVNLARDARQ